MLFPKSVIPYCEGTFRRGEWSRRCAVADGYHFFINEFNEIEINLGWFIVKIGLVVNPEGRGGRSEVAYADSIGNGIAIGSGRVE